tara:strand:+ start:58 stop:435 length:378 start_codon:yes stop_codon:yes gene_type:complete
MTPEEKKEYDKKYYKENKEKIKERKKEFYKTNKEYTEQYYQDNKEKIKTQKKTPQGKKSSSIATWKKIGVKHDDFCSLYEYYLNCKDCEECGKEDIKGNNKHLDHDHTTGLFRNVLCNSCNIRRG